MRYLSVTEIAKKWNVSERSVRNYCAQGRVIGAFLTGKTWNIPENAEKPERTNKRKEEPITLLDILKEQKASKYSGGIYHKTQIDLTYNFLKNGTSDSRKDWFAVGDYKKLPNEVGGMDTALPKEVAGRMKALLTEYNAKEEKTFEDILDFPAEGTGEITEKTGDRKGVIGIQIIKRFGFFIFSSTNETVSGIVKDNLFRKEIHVQLPAKVAAHGLVY